MEVDARFELERILATLATREDMRVENEKMRRHMTIVMERQGRKIQALIDAIELMNHLDS
jgi:hypothetical protein